MVPLRIDVHVHLGGVGDSGSGISLSPRFRRSVRFRFLRRATLRSEGASLEDLAYVSKLARLVRESSAVDRVVALALDGLWRDGALDRLRSPMVVPNDWARDAARRHGELLYGASVSPLRPNALDELDRVAEDGAVLVKWLPNVMGIDPSEARHEPFFRKLADLRLPLLTHCGAEYTLPGGRTALGDPLRLRRALDSGVTVIAAHCGTLCRVRLEGTGRMSGPKVLAHLMATHPNLHADLAALASPLRGWSLGGILDDDRLRPRLLDASDYPVPLLAWTQLGRVPLNRLPALSRIPNYFDRDRAIKRAAGLDEQACWRAASLLRLPRASSAASS